MTRDTDGDVPVHQSTLTNPAEAPEATQETPLVDQSTRQIHRQSKGHTAQKCHSKSTGGTLLLLVDDEENRP